MSLIQESVSATTNLQDEAVIGIDTVGDGQNGNDCDGHGTHVAGTIGGTLYGVAKGVTLHAVRVLDCEGSGFNSDVIAGIDWVTANKIHPAVANMSLGGSPSNALDTAVRNSINSGIVYAVAAGNSNASACNESPARVAEALTVGSTASNDRRSSFSNKGSCVDLFAPGSSITSAGIASNSATNVFSGTSMASPHVAGVAALYRAQNPNATPTQVANALITNATPNVLSSLGTGSPNLLLKVVVGSTDPEPEPDPEPDPDPTPTPILYQGKLKNTGAFQIQPGGTYYTTTTAGLHQGTLQGPVNTDFDLYLYRWNGSSWQEVAYSVGLTSSELILYQGTPGSYYWRIESWYGSGNYQFWLIKPQ
jgi:subtilisin family serine protease